MKKISLLILILVISHISNGQTTKYLLQKGIYKFKLKINSGAIIEINKAIELNLNFEEAYFYRSLDIQDLEFKEKLIDLNFAIRLKSTFVDAYINRGIAK
jgi:hypothetical protein